MAITRAQQFRQMLKDGNVAVQGGAKNYLGEQETVSDVPIKWKSGPNKPKTELAYITDAEKKLLLKEDIHGSLKDGPNKGPGGIISLNGDLSDMEAGITGDDISAAERGETPAGMSPDRAADLRAGALAAGANVRSSDTLDTLTRANKIAKGVRDRYSKQKGLTFAERANLYNIGTKQKMIDRYINQRQKKLSAGLMDDSIPGVDTMTTQELVDLAPSIAGMTDLYSQKTIDDVLAGNRQIDFFTPVEGFSTFGTLANLVGPKMGGPVTKEKLQSLLSEIDTLKSIDPSKTTSKDLMKEFAPNQYEMVYGTPKGGDGENQQPIIPIQTVTSDADDLEDDYYGEAGDPFKNRRAYRFFNKGGIADTVVGGEYDFESARQMYGLGKLVKKVTRTVKKIAKSPIGKAAIIGGLGYLASTGAVGSFFGKGSFNPFLMSPDKGASFGFSGLGSILNKAGLVNTAGGLTGFGKVAAIGVPSIIAGLTAKGSDDDDEEEQYRGEKLDIAAIRDNPYAFIPRRFAAEGGDIEKEPVAKKTMPLLDMGGKEMDLREEGGFVPIGRMEKADDVPARLSKNEFVFTADAVRNAGDGDVDLGAEKMYNMMKNLEAGGDVSEESQGLEGARKMFQTSQRLEEVI